jgi:penicillin-binding protein 1A
MTRTKTKTPKAKQTPRKTGTHKKLLHTLGLLGIFSVVGFLAVMVFFTYDLPDIDKVKPLDTKPSITILAYDGSLMARYGGMSNETVAVKDLPKHLIEAVLSVEDRRFYHHFGIDPFGLARAMLANIRAGRWVQGGSTITQQLAKNMFLTPDKTLRRKVQEAVMAISIERKFSKDQILTAYLNRVYFGAGAYGVDAAAKVYFNKPATKVTRFEGAVLAGLLKAPSRFSPSSNPKLAKERAKTVIQEMREAGYINQKTADKEIKNARIQQVGSTTGALNHYFTDWIIDQIDSFITDDDGDVIVRTTFMPKLQLIAEAKQKAIFKAMKPTEKVSQAALVTLSPDGAVLAMTGGVDYMASQYNRAAQAKRQPGSAFKPFVYLAALESGYTPDSLIDDAKFTTGKYRPDNYDGQYYGKVTLTQALTHSLNTATVRLLQQIGVSKLIDVAERMGFEEKINPDLAAGLGTTEISLLEMTAAYATIQNGGYGLFPYGILTIRNESNEVLYQRQDTELAQNFSGNDIAQLDSMLVQVIAQGTGQGAQLSRGHVAGKTGTTQNYRDAWFIGYTDRLITGVWMGNDDNMPMRKVTGGKYPARLWHDYMQDAIGVEVPSFSFARGGRYQPAAGSALPQSNGDSNPSSSGALDGFGQMLKNITSDIMPEGTKGNNKPVYNR